MGRLNTHHCIRALALACLLILSVPGTGSGQLGSPFSTQPVSFETFVSLSSVPVGGSVQLAIRLNLDGKWHVNANQTNDEFLIPTAVSVGTPDGITVERIVYDVGVEKQLSFSDKPLRLYEDDTLIGIVLNVATEVQPGEKTILATVTYQACDNEKCLAPESKELPISLRVSSATEAIDATHADIFSNIDFASTSGGSAASVDAGQGGRLGAVVANQGYLIAFLLVFVWGLALNLTPCVYPIIPITVGYFGGQAGGRARRTFFLATLYVLGMATMYSALGLVAALTGSILGTALQNPIVVGFVALVLVALAMSMFGFYEIRVPASLSNLAGGASSRGGSIGAFLMGLTVGIVAAPCIGPFVLALLTFVGESANPILGFTLFFTLAIGLGTPFLFLAVLSGSITRLPKSGEWMEWVKKLFGFILISMAIFFLQPLLPGTAYWLLISAVFIGGGIALGFVFKTGGRALFLKAFRTFVGTAAPAFGLYLLLAPGHVIVHDDSSEGVTWAAYDPALLDEAKANGRYVLIDFAADWCMPCKELDHKTFSQPEIIEATSGFTKLRADLTRSGSEEVIALRKKYEIMGVPTVVFIDSKGAERSELRVFGFVDKDDFLERLNRLKRG